MLQRLDAQVCETESLSVKNSDHIRDIPSANRAGLSTQTRRMLSAHTPVSAWHERKQVAHHSLLQAYATLSLFGLGILRHQQGLDLGECGPVAWAIGPALLHDSMHSFWALGWLRGSFEATACNHELRYFAV
jgi:hypothetical protein